MKKWPKDKSKTVPFRDLVKSVKKALLFAYDLKRKNKNKNIPYNGYNVGNSTLVCDFSPKEKLRVKNLKYNLEEQGRDALDVIIGIAVQLGIEQGERSFKGSTEYQLLKIKLNIKETP